MSKIIFLETSLSADECNKSDVAQQIEFISEKFLLGEYLDINGDNKQYLVKVTVEEL